MNKKLCVPLVAVFVLGGCTVTGPADDGWDNSNEWVDNGRLLSDDSSGYTVYSTENKAAGDAKTATDADSSASDTLDFAAYKEWQEAKESNSEEYRKFKQWQEFENFQRWKEAQEAQE